MIDEEGNCAYIEILRGVRKDLDNKVLRFLKSMPEWIPGVTEDGANTYTWFTVPFNFDF